MRSLEDLLKDFRQAKAEIQTVVDNLPRIMGTESVRVIKQNFKLQGYDSGLTVTKWKPRLASTNAAYTRNRTRGKQGLYKGSVFSAGKPILKQTLNLYNNIKYQRTGILSVSVGVDLGLVPYAQAHNEGVTGKTPKRQYMPLPSEGANIKMIKQFESVYNKRTAKAMERFKR